ncbi:terminase large subunit [Pleomorphomonas sp. JP5]|uniref:terminase large subunit n=1 Tax=Pleomorphomonas sp. JP5 TaxID=2942998 RepID=UPI002044C343|nr:terminase TerL endonuclease subunit [Pleomorphomonas sp. JP5]MCM5558081.1 terminase large subunit [Pleomorphomonas sp. JP5]
MGQRGPGAKPIKKPVATVDLASPAIVSEVMPWQRPRMSRVARVVAFLDSLPVTSGVLTGKRFKVRPWQKDFLEAVYTGQKGRRDIRTAVLSMARKNGKTGLAAGLGLCHLAGPEAEERGEVYSAANDRFQAGRLYSEMAAVVERVDWMSERISLRRHAKEMEDLGGTGSVYAALSADVATKHGLSPSFVVYDELGQAVSRDLFDALDTAMGARSEPLMLVISTQAATDTAPMSELIDYGLRVSRGEIEDKTFHLTLYAAPDDADPWSMEAWQAANPALGDFRSLPDVERMANQARRLPSKEAAFRNLILNQRVSAEASLLTVGEWKANGGPVDLDALAGRPCYAGLDLSASRDLTALVLVFADDNGGFDVVPSFWLPDSGLADKAEQDRVPYVVWRDQGHLNTIPGAVIDPRYVAAEVARLHARFKIRKLAYDRWRIEDFKRALADEGIDDIELVPHGQGFRDMAPAVDRLERLVAERNLRHAMQPVLMWNAGNARAVPDPAGNRKLDKSKSTGRIDGIVALAMALNVAERHEDVEEWFPMCEIV